MIWSTATILAQILQKDGVWLITDYIIAKKMGVSGLMNFVRKNKEECFVRYDLIVEAKRRRKIGKPSKQYFNAQWQVQLIPFKKNHLCTRLRWFK